MFNVYPAATVQQYQEFMILAGWTLSSKIPAVLMYHIQKLFLPLLLCRTRSSYDKTRKENYSKTTLLWRFRTVCCPLLNLRQTQNHQIRTLCLNPKRKVEPHLPMAKKKTRQTGQPAQVPAPNADQRKRLGLTLKRLTRT